MEELKQLDGGIEIGCSLGEGVEEILRCQVNRPPPWEGAVLDKCRTRCVNCGSQDHIRVQMIVPESAGGKKTVENGTVLCRACEMALDVSRQTTKNPKHRPVNFWLSRALYKRIKEYNGFTSLCSLVRFLIEKFTEDSGRFDDLSFWQDSGNEVKINVWVDPVVYAQFKEAVNERNMTVTSALKSLLMMYGAEANTLLKPTKREA